MIEALIHRATAGIVTDGDVGVDEPIGKKIVPKGGEGIEFVFIKAQTDLGAGSGDSFFKVKESIDGGSTYTTIFSILFDTDKKDEIDQAAGLGVIGSPAGERQAQGSRALCYQAFYNRSDGTEKYSVHVAAVAIKQAVGEQR